MALEKDFSDEVVILRPDGRISMDLGRGFMVEDIEDLVEDGHRNFVVNLLLVPYLESFGIGVLLRSHNLVYRAKGRLVLCEVSGRTRHVIDMARLADTFRMVESEREAKEVLLALAE